MGLRQCRASRLVVVVFSLLPLTTSLPAQGFSSAKPGQIELLIDVRPVCGMCLPREPTVVVARMHNATDDGLVVFLRQPIRYWVTDAVGNIVSGGHQPVTQQTHDTMIDIVELPPSGTEPIGFYHLYRDCQFVAPGEYTVHALLPSATAAPGRGAQDDHVAALAVASTQHTVRPPRPGETEAMVQYLAWHATWRGFGAFEPVPFWPDAWKRPEIRSLLRDHAGEMLGVMGEEAALPYLVQVAHTEATQWAFDGIAKIATPAARAALELLAGSARTRVAERAQGALTTLPPLTDEPEE